MAYVKVVANTCPAQKGFWTFTPDKPGMTRGEFTQETLAFNLAERVRLDHARDGARIVVSERCYGAFGQCAVIGGVVATDAAPENAKPVKLNGAQVELLCALRANGVTRLHSNRAITASALERRGLVTSTADFQFTITDAGLAWLANQKEMTRENE